MRTILLGALASAALSLGAVQSASAADIPPARTVAPSYKAPAVVPAFSWTGIYIGAHAGGAWANYRRTDDTGLQLNNIDARSWIAGGQIGANYQVQNFVFGVELSGSGTGLSGSELCPNTAFTCTTKQNYVLFANGRFGFAWDRALLYVTGGYAHTQTKTSTEPAYAGFDSSSNHGGWNIGGGLEYAFTPNWIAGVEYIHADFRSTRYADPTGANTPYTVDPKLSLVRGRLSYKF